MSHKALTISAIAALECLATMKIISRASATRREREEVRHLLGSCGRKAPGLSPAGQTLVWWALPSPGHNLNGPRTLHKRLALPRLCGVGWWDPGGQTVGSFIGPSQPDWKLLLSLGVW